MSGPTRAPPLRRPPARTFRTVYIAQARAPPHRAPSPPHTPPQPPLPSPRPHPPTPTPPPQVGRFAFRLLHRLEGRWTGEAEVHVPGAGGQAQAAAASDVRVCTVQREDSRRSRGGCKGRGHPPPRAPVAVSFDDLAGVWRETQNLTSRDGLVTSQAMLLRPIADGVCRVELAPLNLKVRAVCLPTCLPAAPAPCPPRTPTRLRQEEKPAPRHRSASSAGGGGHSAATPSSAADPAHRRGGGHAHAHRGGTSGAPAAGDAESDFEMSLTEHGESILILTAFSRATGLPVLVETITLLSDMRVSRG